MGTLISGRRAKQHKDLHMEWHMDEYVDKMKPIEFPRGYITHTRETCLK